MSRWLLIHSAEILHKNTQRILITLQKKKIVVLNTCLADGKPSSEFLVAMNATCPHSGGPLELGVLEDFDIEDLDKTKDGCRGKVLVCPWHSYRFDTLSGKSIDDDIFTAQVYPVKIEDGNLFVECNDGDEIQDVTLFEVQKSAVPVPVPIEEIFKRIDLKPDLSAKEMMEALVGKSLFEWCICILNCEDAQKKVALTIALKEKWDNNEIKEIKESDKRDPVPDRPARNKSLQFVDPSKVKKRGKGNSVASRIAILHALANVEQWAIDLAIDIMVRFSNESFQSQDGTLFTLHEQREFFTDFIKVASDEARHFTYLVERLNALGADYGDLPCHQGLWDSALDTKDSLMARLAIVHMVHEARGLDVNPQTIEKFRRAGDSESVDKLEQIHQDEVTHVATGQRWFAWVCSIMNIDRYQTFHGYVKKHFWGYLKPPFNEKDRDRAGLDPQYYKPLTEEGL